MFSHLFNTYEAVTPPPKSRQDFKEEIYLDPENEIEIIDTLRSSSIFPQVNKSLDQPFVSNTPVDSVDRIPLRNEVFNLNSLDPFLTNQDTRSPSVSTSTGKFSNKGDFIRSLNAGYRRALSRKGLNPDYSYILTAQAAMESGWGKHLAGKYNFGGIKISDREARVHPERANRALTTDWSRERGYFRHYLNFRNFSSLDDYCNYRIDLLSNSRYNAFNSVNVESPYNFVFHILSRGYGSDYGGPESRRYVASVMKNYNTILNTLRT